jgi:hypothetical protein
LYYVLIHFTIIVATKISKLFCTTHCAFQKSNPIVFWSSLESMVQKEIKSFTVVCCTERVKGVWCINMKGEVAVSLKGENVNIRGLQNGNCDALLSHPTPLLPVPSPSHIRSDVNKHHWVDVTWRLNDSTSQQSLHRSPQSKTQTCQLLALHLYALSVQIWPELPKNLTYYTNSPKEHRKKLFYDKTYVEKDGSTPTLSSFILFLLIISFSSSLSVCNRRDSYNDVKLRNPCWRH